MTRRLARRDEIIERARSTSSCEGTARRPRGMRGYLVLVCVRHPGSWSRFPASTVLLTLSQP